MLTYNLEGRGKTPIYEYIYNCIRNDIISGRIKSGEKLPSKRELASDNGIALITVENAYDQLVIEGYVEAKPRRGYFVTDIGVDYINDNGYGNNGIGNSFQNYNEEKKHTSVKKDKNDVNNSNNDIFNFTSSGFQADFFPYSVWSKLMRRVISENEKEFAKAPSPAGIYELRKAIADYLLRAKNLVVDADRIIIGPGTEYLHSILLQLIGRNRLVAVEDPGYKQAERIYESNGMKVMHIPVAADGIRVDKLIDSNSMLVHVSPAHHFPTGAVMSATTRHKLLAYTREQNAYIIEDDYDSEFRFKGKPLRTLMSLDSEHVIYMNTFTGSIAPSIRIAYMVLPEKLMPIYNEKLGYISGTVSTFDQLVLAAFISEGYYERHINRMRNRYRRLRLRYMDALKKSKLDSIANIIEDGAGISFVLKIQTDKEDIDLINKLSEDQIKIRCMTDYCYHTSDKYKHSFVLRYLEIEEAELVIIFNRIYESTI